MNEKKIVIGMTDICYHSTSIFLKHVKNQSVCLTKTKLEGVKMTHILGGSSCLKLQLLLQRLLKQQNIHAADASVVAAANPARRR